MERGSDVAGQRKEVRWQDTERYIFMNIQDVPLSLAEDFLEVKYDWLAL